MEEGQPKKGKGSSFLFSNFKHGLNFKDYLVIGHLCNAKKEITPVLREHGNQGEGEAKAKRRKACKDYLAKFNFHGRLKRICNGLRLLVFSVAENLTLSSR